MATALHYASKLPQGTDPGADPQEERDVDAMDADDTHDHYHPNSYVGKHHPAKRIKLETGSSVPRLTRGSTALPSLAAPVPLATAPLGEFEDEEDDDDDDAMVLSNANKGLTEEDGQDFVELRRKRKRDSNQVKMVKERQRRSNMTASIHELRALIPACAADKKANQSVVMAHAVAYIKELHKRLTLVAEQNQQLMQALAQPGQQVGSLGGDTALLADASGAAEMTAPASNRRFHSTSQQIVAKAATTQSPVITPPAQTSAGKGLAPRRRQHMPLAAGPGPTVEFRHPVLPEAASSLPFAPPSPSPFAAPPSPRPLVSGPSLGMAPGPEDFAMNDIEDVSQTWPLYANRMATSLASRVQIGNDPTSVPTLADAPEGFEDNLLSLDLKASYDGVPLM